MEVKYFNYWYKNCIIRPYKRINDLIVLKIDISNHYSAPVILTINERRNNVKKQRAPALPDSATFRQLWDALGSKLIESAQGNLLYTQGVRGSSPLPPTTTYILIH